MTSVGTSEILLILGCVLGLVFPALFLFALIMALTRKSRGWTIAAVVSGILTLFLAFGAVVAGTVTAVKSTKESSKPTAFSTSDGVATVMGGPFWRNLDIGSDDATLGIGNPLKEEYLVVISEPKGDFPDGFTIRQFAEVASGQALANVKDVTGPDFEEILVSGMPALRREVTGQADGLGVFYINTYLEGRGHFHQVMTWTLLENKDNSRTLLEAAGDSFREIRSAVP